MLLDLATTLEAATLDTRPQYWTPEDAHRYGYGRDTAGRPGSEHGWSTGNGNAAGSRLAAQAGISQGTRR